MVLGPLKADREENDDQNSRSNSALRMSSALLSAQVSFGLGRSTPPLFKPYGGDQKQNSLRIRLSRPNSPRSMSEPLLAADGTSEPLCLHYRQRSASASAAKRIAIAAAMDSEDDDDDEDYDDERHEEGTKQLIERPAAITFQSESSDDGDSTDCTSTETSIARRKIRAALYPRVARDAGDEESDETSQALAPIAASERILLRISRDSIASARLRKTTEPEVVAAAIAAAAAAASSTLADVNSEPVCQPDIDSEIGFCVNMFVRGITRVPDVSGFEILPPGYAKQNVVHKVLRSSDLLYSCLENEIVAMETATRHLMRDGTRFMLGLMDDNGLLLSRTATVLSAEVKPGATLTACIVVHGVNLLFRPYNMCYVTLSQNNSNRANADANCIPVWYVGSFHTLEHLKLAWLAANIVHTGTARYQTYKHMFLCFGFRMKDGRLFFLYDKHANGTLNYERKAPANYHDLETLDLRPRTVIEMVIASAPAIHGPHVF